jgi:hypothetical protein
MSGTLKSKKKPELQAIAADLGTDTDGSKSELEARILLHLSEHTELKGDPKFSKYFASITNTESASPLASAAQGGNRRRSVPAKKSTDLGETISKGVTRYPPFVYICLWGTGSADLGAVTKMVSWG